MVSECCSCCRFRQVLHHQWYISHALLSSGPKGEPWRHGRVYSDVPAGSGGG